MKLASVVFEQANPHSKIQRLMHWAMGSWIMHVSMIVSDTEVVEAEIPKVRETLLADKQKEWKDCGGVWNYDIPDLTDEQRVKIATVAKEQVGRPYAVLNCLWYFLTHWWIVSRFKSLVCSWAIYQAYTGAGVELFPNLDQYNLSARHKWNLQNGLCVPADLLAYSILKEVKE
jgi:uncharacterized protein YycO